MASMPSFVGWLAPLHHWLIEGGSWKKTYYKLLRFNQNFHISLLILTDENILRNLISFILSYFIFFSSRGKDKFKIQKTILVDICFGGMWYAIVDADALNLGKMEITVGFIHI